MNKFIERRESPIHGIGSFARVDIPRQTDICIGHYQNGYRTYHRTRDIGFFNYSKKPNAILPYVTRGFKNGKGTITVMKTISDIKKGDEILLKYSWYDPTKPDTEENRHYKPLPDNVYLKEDRLYASKDIEIFNEFGVSHNFIPYLDKYVANPLGGFLSKDTSPNCIFVNTKEKKELLSIKSIKKDTLLTINNYE